MQKDIYCGMEDPLVSYINLYKGDLKLVECQFTNLTINI